MFVRLSGPKQSLDKKDCLAQKLDPLIHLKLHFPFCSHCLYQHVSQQQHCVRCWEALLDQDMALK